MKTAVIIWSMSFFALIGCRKDVSPLPQNTQTMIQGEWQLKKFKSKTWKGRVRTGGTRVDVELRLTIDTARYSMTDYENTEVMAGTYSIVDDSIFFVNELENDAEDGRFLILSLSDKALELKESQTGDLRIIGEVYSEGVYSYER